MNTQRHRDALTAAHQQIAAKHEADEHWHADMHAYWMQQEVPPKDERWMAAWLSTHSPSQLFPAARDPKEQREYRAACLRDAFYDSARMAAWRKLYSRR